MQILTKTLSASVLIMLLPSVTLANYCIQVSSVNSVDKVYILKQVHHKTLQNEPDLRIEKLGKFYALRVGDFSHKSDAKASLKRIHKSFKDAYIRQCIKHPQYIIYPSQKNMKKPKIKPLIEEKISCSTMLAPNYDSSDERRSK